MFMETAGHKLCIFLWMFYNGIFLNFLLLSSLYFEVKKKVFQQWLLPFLKKWNGSTAAIVADMLKNKVIVCVFAVFALIVHGKTLTCCYNSSSCQR